MNCKNFQELLTYYQELCVENTKRCEFWSCRFISFAESTKRCEFWSCVALTASDELQAVAMRKQIKRLQDDGNVPSGTPFHVISDCSTLSGDILGSGGATMNALHVLQTEYGAEFEEMRILLIHTGVELVQKDARFGRVLIWSCRFISFAESTKRCEFWSCVALTASDELQAVAMRKQIKRLQDDGNVPSGTPFHVISDCSTLSGDILGSGGATMNALHVLQTEYGAEFEEMRILLIHTGGQSKRLPSHSAMGKLFGVLPVNLSVGNNRPWLLLDIKLAMYLPFISMAPPGGVFVTCSDDIETYRLPTSEAKKLRFRSDGFTALAHPSTLDIAATHGVYVIASDKNANDKNAMCYVSDCLHVLQKPTLEQMQEADAIRLDENGKQFAYTDSVYFFSHDVSRALIRFFVANKPLQREIDAYGDFLKNLGIRTSPKCTDPLHAVLDQFPLSVMVLEQSKFYHLGTVAEFLDNICDNVEFRQELSLIRPSSGNGSLVQGVVMHSRLCSESKSDPRSVIEYCEFHIPLDVGKNSIVSRCSVKRDDGVTSAELPSKISVPQDVIMYTVPIRCSSHGNNVAYVTFAFGCGDDLKRKLRFDCGDNEGRCEVTYCGKTVSNPKVFGDCQSLWEARLFEAKPTPTLAFLSTLKLLESGICFDEPSVERHSMRSVLLVKDVDAIMISDRALVLKSNADNN